MGGEALGTPMELTIKANKGIVEIRASQRADNRWASEYRYVPNHGAPSDWKSASSPEGFVSVGMAMSAAILLGKHHAEERATEKAHPA